MAEVKFSEFPPEGSITSSKVVGLNPSGENAQFDATVFKGDDGTSATADAGDTTTLPAGSLATVTNAGTPSDAVFNFGIPEGADGSDGNDGAAATIAAGDTTTLAAGSLATVTNVGTPAAAIFDFGIPEGADGIDGDAGLAATIAVDSTTTLPPGSQATVVNVGSPSAASFQFGIPEGEQGPQGDAGSGYNLQGDATVAELNALTASTITTNFAWQMINSGSVQPTGAVQPVTVAAGDLVVWAEADYFVNYGATSAGGTGDVTGPDNAITNRLASFSDNTGKVIKDAGILSTAIVSGPGSATSGNIATYSGPTGKVIADTGIKASDFATSVQGGKADTALQPNANITELTNNAGYLTTTTGDARYYTETEADGLFATAAQGATADSALQSVIGGTGITVDATDPQNPTITADGGGGTGDVSGPATSQDNHLAVWNGTSGELLQDSAKNVDDVVTNTGVAVSANFAAFNGGSGKVIQDAGVGSSSFVSSSFLSTITSALQPNDDITELNNNAGFKAYYSGATLPVDTSGYAEGDLFMVTS